MSRFALAIAALMLAVGLAACGGGGSSTGGGSETSAGNETSSGTETASSSETSGGNAEGAQLAFFVPLQNGFTEAVLKGAEQAAKERGATISQVFTADGELPKQISQIQDAIVSGKYEGFLIHPLGPEIEPAVNEAIAKGIPVGIVEGTLDGENPLEVAAPEGASITTTEPLQLRVEGLVESAIKTCKSKDPCNIGFIMGIKQNPSSIAVLEGFESGIESESNIHVVAVGQGLYSAGPARSAAEDMLTSNPDINVFVSDDDLMTKSAELAANAAGKTDIEYISVGATKAGCEAVEAGTWVSTTNALPFDSGELGAEGVLNTIEDPSKINQVVNPLEVSGLPLNSVKGSKCPGQWTE